MADEDLLFDAAQRLNANDSQLSRIADLIRQEREAVAAIDTAEALLEDAKAQRRSIIMDRLPAAMLDAGMREFVTADGLKAKITFMTDGALGPARNPEERAAREAKLDLIIEHGGGEIVKQMIVIEFPKEAIEAAETIRERLVKLFETKKWGNFKPAIYRERSVNHMTLGSWIRQRMEGEIEDQLPPTFFERVGIWYGEAAKIIMPKKPKADK